jgi:hypothetical protein
MHSPVIIPGQLAAFLCKDIMNRPVKLVKKELINKTFFMFLRYWFF